MSAVFEPVAHLGGRQSGGLRQFLFLGGVRIRVLEIPLAEQAPGALLETVGLLFAVPYGTGQRKLLADPVLVDGAQRPAPQFFRFLVVRFQPHGLQFAVRVLGELVVFEYGVHVAVVAAVERHDSPGSEHGLVFVEFDDIGVGDGQRPQESGQPFDVAALLERLAHAGHLGHAEVEHGQPEHRVGHHRRHGR